MDQKTLEEFCRAHAECIRHADARSADSRTRLQESDSQPIVIMRLLPRPHECEECGRELRDRKLRTHTRRADGWRSHCSGCNRVRQPGSSVFGQTTGVRAADRGVNRLGPREELLPEPKQPQTPEPQSGPIEHAPIVDFVDSVIVRDYPESLITEYVSRPIEIRPQSSDAPGLDSEVRKD